MFSITSLGICQQLHLNIRLKWVIKVSNSSQFSCLFEVLHLFPRLYSQKKITIKSKQILLVYQWWWIAMGFKEEVLQVLSSFYLSCDDEFVEKCWEVKTKQSDLPFDLLDTFKADGSRHRIRDFHEKLSLKTFINCLDAAGGVEKMMEKFLMPFISSPTKIKYSCP